MDVSAELAKGGGGIFDVEMDGEIVFSKKQAGRFPEHEEVLASLRKD
jgi:selenoprotein W-related protein